MGNTTSNLSSGSKSFERFDRSNGTARDQFYTRDRDQALERRDFHREQCSNARTAVVDNCVRYTGAAAAVTALGGPIGAAHTATVSGIANSHHIARAIGHEFKAGQAQREADFANKVLDQSKSNN